MAISMKVEMVNTRVVMMKTKQSREITRKTWCSENQTIRILMNQFTWPMKVLVGILVPWRSKVM